MNFRMDLVLGPFVFDVIVGAFVGVGGGTFTNKVVDRSGEVGWGSAFRRMSTCTEACTVYSGFQYTWKPATSGRSRGQAKA